MEFYQEKAQNAETQVLLKWLLNAAATQKGCNGHYKANTNRLLTELYESELIKRGLNVCLIQYPIVKVLLDRQDVTAQGVYNGEGAY